MRILVFSAHPDDVMIGAGGTILNHVEKNHEIFIYIFSHSICEDSEITNIKRLGIKTCFLEEFDKIDLDTASILKVMNLIRKDKPDLILTHIPEGHSDHIKTSLIVTRATELASNKKLKSNFIAHKVKKIYFFENIESTLANADTEKSITFININRFFKKKIELIEEFIKLKKHLPYLVELVDALAKLRGFQSRSKYAEAFICYPIIQDADEIREAFSGNLIVDFEKNCYKLLE